MAIHIGYYTVTIINSERVVETTNEAKASGKKSIKTMIVPAIVGTILSVCLIIAVFFLVKMIKKRKFNKNHRNPTIL